MNNVNKQLNNVNKKLNNIKIKSVSLETYIGNPMLPGGNYLCSFSDSGLDRHELNVYIFPCIHIYLQHCHFKSAQHGFTMWAHVSEGSSPKGRGSEAIAINKEPSATVPMWYLRKRPAAPETLFFFFYLMMIIIL